jgi:hypothetical protein
MIVVAASFVARPRPALADANEVSVSPPGIEVAPGGAATVQLIADPPVETLAVWAIDVLFDPEVVTTSTRNCDTLDPPANSTAVGLCLVNDENDDGVVETVTVLGGLVFNDDGNGLRERTVLADITFEVVGAPGECSNLRLGVRYHTDSQANPTEPLVFDGRICVEQSAPPSGTAVPFTPEARTSDPTPPGGGGVTPPPLQTETFTSGAEPDAVGTQSPSPGHSASQTPTPAVGSEEGGGGGVTIWVVLIGVAGLVVAAATAWIVVRLRSVSSGQEGGPSAG